MITLHSPAKINLFLRVLSKRADGFHNLASLFQTIDLHDTLTFQLTDQDAFDCTDLTIPRDQTNLVLRAVELFKQKTGYRFCAKIQLIKRIPALAGLGGGSSNAATTLVALNRLHHNPVDFNELSNWGAELGSDISFFFSEGTAYCTGKGEEVTPMISLKQNHPMYLIKPPFGISTPQVFSKFILQSEELLDPKTLLSNFYNRRPLYHNDLEQPALQIAPELQNYKQNLLNIGFENVFMTGSGSALCCIGEPDFPLTLPFNLFKKIHYIHRTEGEWYLENVKL